MITNFKNYDNINESGFFGNNDMLTYYLSKNTNIKVPKFKIGDEVYHIDKNLSIYDSTPNCTYGRPHDIDDMLNYIGDNKLKIISKFKGEDSNDFPWWSEVYIIGKEHSEKYYLIDDALSFHKSPPTYKPKEKSERILESVFPNEADFRVWCDTASKSMEFEKLLYNNGWKWPYYDSTPSYSPRTYIFFPKTKFIDAYSRNICISDGKIIYKYPEQLNIIIQKISSTPTYNPKEKIKRSLESTKWYPYRFKTEEEFINDYGNNWENMIDCGWNEYMNHLWGKIYSFYVDENSELPDYSDDIDNDYDWSISWDMLTKNIPNKPTYKPKGKSNRILEFNNNSNDASEITIYIENVEQLKLLKNEIKPLGYDIDYPFFNVVKEDGPINIFIHVENKIITQTKLTSSSDILKKPLFDGVWEKILTIDDLSLIKSILKTKKIGEPSYDPKKIKRILESRNSIIDSNEIYIKINNIDELKTLLTLLKKYNYYTLVDYDSRDMDYPFYIFVNLITKNVLHSYLGYHYSDENGNININCSEFDNVYSEQYTMKNLNIIDSILKNGKIIPSNITYKPRKKIERTLESTNIYPYRFKTEEEFINDYGHDWYEKINNGWCDDMDYLFGQPCKIYNIVISNNKMTYKLLDINAPRGYWVIENKMLTPIKPYYISKGKPNRILEYYNNINNADEICIKLNNNDDLEKFFNYISTCDGYYNLSFRNLKDIKNYPIFIFVNIKNCKLMYSTSLSNDNMIDITDGVYDGVYEYIFDFNNTIWKQIVKYKKIIPSVNYSPKSKNKREI